MTAKKEIDEHLKIALEEIGEIHPWFDKEVKEWIFSDRLYPVVCGGKSKKEVVDNYPKYLREFIKYRLDKKVAHLVEKKAKGLGGERPRYIALADWNKHHECPPLGGLRHLVFHAKTNGFDKVIRRIGRRIVMNEDAFFEWVEEQNKEK